MMQYCTDNKGYFTAGARGVNSDPSDFIYWQQPQSYWIAPARPAVPGETLAQVQDQGALVRYMGKHFNANNWICPSDNVSIRPRNNPPYAYSYDMNMMLANNLDATDTNALAWIGGKVMKLSRVRHPSTTLLMQEETSLTIDDGYFSTVGFDVYNGGNPGEVNMNGYWIYPGNTGYNWLAVWHDNKVHRPDEVLTPSEQTLVIPNPQGRGNAVFCDGHAEFTTRAYIQSPRLRHWDPSF